MLNVGMVGVGSISGIYLQNITNTFKNIRLLGVCDLIRERAENAQQKYNVPKLYETMQDMFADPEIDVVLNLTRPYQHYEVSRQALEAGKHVYSEKPLGASFEEGKKLAALAQEKKLMLGGAPDTFLGAGIQTCRKIIDDGVIGKPIGANALMISHGCESWHPDPDFFYQFGGGPMMDMGPYYITCLVNLMGGVKTVSAMTRRFFDQRICTCKEHFGETINVNVDTHITGLLGFDSGAVATVTTTFDVHANRHSQLEIFGERGTLYVPDPNFFDGPVSVYLPEDGGTKEFPLMFDYRDNFRALGLSDFISSIETGRECRTDWHQTLHVLEILTSFVKASEAHKEITLETHYDRKMPMKHNPMRGILD